MSSKIKNITVTNSSTSATETIPAAISQIYYNDKNNLNVVTDSTDIVSGKGGKINVEAASDIQLKPTDDLILYSSHRSDTTEATFKVTDGDDNPVKFLANMSEILLTNKQADGTAGGNFDVTVNAAKDTKGNLKIKAKSTDIRCYDGGVALQCGGKDSSGHENKIKFESDRTNAITNATGTYADKYEGGEGLEFGTFNNQHTSLFTNDYRFNEDGIVYAVTRGVPVKASGDTKTDYPTLSDDFKDIISSDADKAATWSDIVKTAYTFNGDKNRHAHITDSGNVEIETIPLYMFSALPELENFTDDDVAFDFGSSCEVELNKLYTVSELIDIDENIYDLKEEGLIDLISKISKIGDVFCEVLKYESPNINLVSGKKIQFTAEDNIELTSNSGNIKLNGDLDFGSTFNFGETDEAIKVNKKLTKKGNAKNCDILLVVFTNNSSDAVTPSESDYEVTPTNSISEVAAGESSIIASCSIYDIIKLVNYMKTNNQGPWATA